jgi:hypothetical protein
MAKKRTTLIDESAPADAPMWERLSEYGRGQVNAVLDDAAKQYGCDRKDLVWGIDKGGGVHVKKAEVSQPKKGQSKMGKREREKPAMIEGFDVRGGKVRRFSGRLAAVKGFYPTLTKEEFWDKDNPDYMGITEAVEEAKKRGRRLSVPTLSRKLTPDGQMRYMVKYAKSGNPSRRKVHIGDFRTYLKTVPLADDPFSEEAFARRQTEIRREKEAKGKHRSKREGLERLLKKTEA